MSETICVRLNDDFPQFVKRAFGDPIELVVTDEEFTKRNAEDDTEVGVEGSVTYFLQNNDGCELNLVNCKAVIIDVLSE